MIFDTPLEEGFFVRRYQRFFAEFRLASGELITVHCPNTGSMRRCYTQDGPVWFSRSTDPKRKLGYTWELAVSPDGDIVGVNTGRANRLVREALMGDLIPGLGPFDKLQAEVRYGRENSRIDFVATGGAGQLFIEIKSVTLCEGGGQGYFPDCISTRATRHLRELQAVRQAGGRALLIFCVQHSGIERVAPARHIDPAYGLALDEAVASGLEVIALGARLNRDGIWLDRVLEVDLSPE